MAAGAAWGEEDAETQEKYMSEIDVPPTPWP
jgi:hypothetical protein